jgi:transposase
MTRDGLPVRSWLFRGDTVDVTTVAQVKADLRGWKLTRTVFVGDAGMVSDDNLKTLAQGGGKYILCMPVKAGNEVSEEVLSRPGRYRTVAPNLEVKEVVVGDGERRRRYVVCYNAEEAARQQAHRAQILAELEAVLPDLQRESRHSKRVCALRASERYGQYLTQDRSGRLAIDAAKVRQAERRDGKFVVHSNDDTLTSDDLALGYKQLTQVERAWRLLKSGLRIRPIFHWAPHRIAAHVSLTMVGLLLERLAENACHDTWRNIRDDLRQIKLAQFLTPQGELWQVTEPGPAAANRLKQLHLPPPPPVLKVAPPPTHTAPWA